MYTYEIIETIRRGNGTLTPSQYMDICKNSPQITDVCIDPEDYTKFNRFVFKCSDYDGEIKFAIEG